MNAPLTKSAYQTVLENIEELMASMTTAKKAFVPMTPDMPPGGGTAGNDGPQSGMPPGGGMMPQGGGAGGPPPGGDPSGGGGMPPGGDPSGGGGMPPGGDPSGGAGGPPPPGGDPSQAGGGPPTDGQGSDPYGPVFESILQGMQQLMETVQQIGQEMDQRIAKVEQSQTANQQAQDQTKQTLDQVMPFIQSMQQPAPMDGSVQGGDQQQQPMGGVPDDAGSGPTGDPMMGGGMPPMMGQMPQDPNANDPMLDSMPQGGPTAGQY